MKTLNEYKKKVIDYHDMGNSCSQSTALTFKDLVDVDEKTLYTMMEAFGSGMGNKEGTCGAATGCVSILSLLASSGTIDNPTKLNTYEIASDFMEEFFVMNKAYACKTIKGEDKVPVVSLVSCSSAMENAVEILYNTINKYNLA
jgi:C_GCAxxG_C_C family probable redox protein